MLKSARNTGGRETCWRLLTTRQKRTAMIDNSIVDEFIEKKIPGEPFQALDELAHGESFLDKLGNVWFDEGSLRRFISSAPFLRLTCFRCDLDPRVISLPLDSGQEMKNYFRDDLVADLIKTANERATESAEKYQRIRVSEKYAEPKKRQTDARSELDMIRNPVDGEFQMRGRAWRRFVRLVPSTTDPYTKDNSGGLAILNFGTNLKKHGLTASQYRILSMIKQGGPIEKNKKDLPEFLKKKNEYIVGGIPKYCSHPCLGPKREFSHSGTIRISNG